MADEELAITQADMAAYLKKNPGMAGMMGAVVDVMYEKARRRRPDLSDSEFATLFRQVLPAAPWREETIVAEILAGIQAFRPAPPTRGQPGAPILDEAVCGDEVRAALKRLAARGDRRPTRISIAAEIGLDPRTLRAWRSRFPSVAALLPPPRQRRIL